MFRLQVFPAHLFHELLKNPETSEHFLDESEGNQDGNNLVWVALDVFKADNSRENTEKSIVFEEGNCLNGPEVFRKNAIFVGEGFDDLEAVDVLVEEFLALEEGFRVGVKVEKIAAKWKADGV